VSDLLAAAYGAITATVQPLDASALARPTRCKGWTVADVVYHLLLDAQRALVTLASPTDAEPDVDDVSYWAPHEPGTSWSGEHERFVRASTAAHSEPGVVVRRWVETAGAAARAAAATPGAGRVRTQGHVLTVDDFVSTLVVEALLHHLDLSVELSKPTPPDPEVLDHCRRVFDRMLRTPAPADWPTPDYALAAGGRVDVPADVQSALGDAATRFPLLG
jgi:uncharacterized protein (TIGR03083 family)